MNAIAMNGGFVDAESSGRFLFSSRIPSDQRAALEHLVFFNEHQSRVRGALREVIERWGCPEIVEEAGFLSVTLARHAASRRVATSRRVKTAAASKCFFDSGPRPRTLHTRPSS
jgi:hypothetical protein